MKELKIKDLKALKAKILALNPSDKVELLKCFDDVELMNDLKNRGAICSTNTLYKSEIERLQSITNEQAEQLSKTAFLALVGLEFIHYDISKISFVDLDNQKKETLESIESKKGELESLLNYCDFEKIQDIRKHHKELEALKKGAKNV